MDSEELIRLYQEGQRDFSKEYLRSTSFTNCNLDSVDFSQANLKFAKFYNANLSNANFAESDLSKAKFRNANLQNADLSNAKLHKADFESANLSNANLDNADLTWAELIDANLDGVDISKAKNAVTIANISPPKEDNPNFKLLSSLKEATSDISFSSEGYYPYEFFIWDKKISGSFSIEKLIEIVGHENTKVLNRVNVPPKSYIDYESYEDIAEEYRIDGDFYELFCDPVSLAESDLYAKYQHFDYFFGFIYENPNNLRWENYEKYKKFADLILDNLTRIKLYRIGEIQVHFYLVGEAGNGDLIGIHSISIET
ncbi:MAG: pentapeptide repeat-containing protein [Cyanobacteria bacterium P01_A01_bin.83]